MGEELDLTQYLDGVASALTEFIKDYIKAAKRHATAGQTRVDPEYVAILVQQVAEAWAYKLAARLLIITKTYITIGETDNQERFLEFEQSMASIISRALSGDERPIEGISQLFDGNL